jgi:hypothetical protein
MRPVIFLSVLAVATTFASSVLQAQTCPRSATQASTQIWPLGSIPGGMSVTERHPCGRRITCIGGRQGSIGSRHCSWT